MLIESHAVANNGELTEEQKQSFWQRLNFKKTDTQLSLNEIDKPIVFFDVSESHELLIAFDDNNIAITDAEYNIVSFYNFNCDGSYYVFWSDGNIGLLLGRSESVIEINVNGDLVNITPQTDVHKDIIYSWNDFANEHCISVGDTNYIVKNKMGVLNPFLQTYSQLLVEDTNSKEIVVLYDINSEEFIKNIVFLCLFLLFVLLVAIILFKGKRNNQGTVL